MARQSGSGSCSHLLLIYPLPRRPNVGFIQIQPGYQPDYCAKQPYSLIRQISDDSLGWKEQGEKAEGEKQRFQEKSGEVFSKSLNSLEFRVWGNRTDGQKYKRFRQLIRPGAVSPAHNPAQLFVFL